MSRKAPSERILYGKPEPGGRTPFWRSTSLWNAAERGRPVKVPIAELGILDAVVWFGGPDNVEPTVRRVAERAADISAADLTYPIIMTRSGDVLDGAHRIARAYLEGKITIAAVILDDWPPPDGFAEPATDR